MFFCIFLIYFIIFFSFNIFYSYSFSNSKSNSKNSLSISLSNQNNNQLNIFTFNNITNFCKNSACSNMKSAFLITFDSSHFSKTKWTQALIPTLSYNARKGENGRVAVIGGSFLYTGAPYYSAMASLASGSDLSFILTSESAAIPLKCMSPELMVMPFYKEKEVKSVENIGVIEDENDEEEKLKSLKERKELESKLKNLLPRLKSLVIGPGLGRQMSFTPDLSYILSEASYRKIPVILDADSLWMISQDIISFLRASPNSWFVLTPNLKEFSLLISGSIYYLDEILLKKLDDLINNNENNNENLVNLKEYLLKIKNVLEKDMKYDEISHENILIKSHIFSLLFGGVTLLVKGRDDCIINKNFFMKIENLPSNMKRSGGQGDLLSGVLGTTLGWAMKLEKINTEEDSNAKVFSYFTSFFGSFDENNQPNIESLLTLPSASSFISAEELNSYGYYDFLKEHYQISLKPSLRDTEEERKLEEKEDVLVFSSVLLASYIVKHAGYKSYLRHKRGTSALKILDEIPLVLEEIKPSPMPTDFH